jgi:hypothetical protein
VTRQRVHLRTPALAYLIRLLTVIFGVALVWYGSMVILLAVKVSPHTVSQISAYRTLYDDIVNLTAGDFTTPVRLIAGFGGFLAFLILAFLALQELPRPYLTRGPVTIDQQPEGRTIARARSIERLAEIAAHSTHNVTTAAGRLSEDALTVNISVRRASLAAETLNTVQHKIRKALTQHQLPALPVNVTLTGYDRTTKRELS